MRILAVADEVSEALYGPTLKEIEPDLVVSCGDLPFDYLEYIVTVTNVPLAYVFGNHDPSLKRRQDPRDVWKPGYLTEAHHPEPGAQGCTLVDNRLVDVAGVRILGLGGSQRYNDGPHQYTERQMRSRARRLGTLARLKRIGERRKVDLIVTHSPPAGVGDLDDGVHEGFRALHPLMATLKPRYLIHGHIHPYGNASVDRELNGTTVINAVGYRVLEI